VHDLLELQAEPVSVVSSLNSPIFAPIILFRDFGLVRFDDVLWRGTHHEVYDLQRYGLRALMMMTSVERKSVGFAAGSRTVDDDWKDWKRPVISRESAKLFRNKTWNIGFRNEPLHWTSSTIAHQVGYRGVK
jgi:hypothetical protein